MLHEKVICATDAAKKIAHGFEAQKMSDLLKRTTQYRLI